ncbi:hypothetical protein EUTSA_v10006423mg [Eutrema salsugineum]|uniref:LOB domain-containing protein n=1 Tax=Eutrema salsugineum TaxID=72664 RepID=V4LWI1_EUTSA|nr:LOB domain-containing protein 16 [Eutrema salsugineum]ESQ44253.1 hypothetical protein EUTSA_v10006423mg [Eutrema salsugineum]
MASSSTRTGSPCGACKFLRRKCVLDCVFAPYFSTDESPVRFAAIHKVFGASNVSKILLHVPVQQRYEVVFTMAYEAESRLHDPVYGCVSHVFALQQQVAFLQAQLMQLKANLAHQTITTVVGDLRNRSEMTWQQTNGHTTTYKPYYSYDHSNKPVLPPQSSIESLEHSNTSSEVTTNVPKIQIGRFGFLQDCYPNY